MKQRIKDWLALKMVTRGKKRTFSYDELEVKHVDPPIKAFNDSSYFAGISKEGVTFVTRQAFRVDKPNENWMMIHIPGEGVFGFENREMKEGEGFKQDSLIYQCEKSGEEWNIRFEGELPQGSKKGFLKLDLSWKGTAPIVVFDKVGTTSQQVSKQIAAEKWNGYFFKKLKELDQVHYEQAGKLTGSFVWNGKEYNTEFTGVRDHSWGVRNWEDWDRHFWLLGLLEDGRFFNFSKISYSFVKNLQAAFIYNFDHYKTMHHIPLLEEIKMDCLMPKKLSFDVMEDKGGALKNMSLEMKHFFPFHMDNDYYLRQAKADFVYDGVKGVGIAEMGINLKNYNVDVDNTY